MDLSEQIETVVTIFQSMQPTQRRQLLRRLHASGLLDGEELLTDRNRLHTSPSLNQAALARIHRAQADRQQAAALRSAKPRLIMPEAPVAQQSREDEQFYRSAVSGKVVMGAPGGSSETPDDPHAMSPLPGQAPDQPIRVIFDGGSKGNPGQGYGSYALRWPSQPQQVVKLRFGNNVTNNEAEYDTLIAALEAILQRLLDGKADPNTAQVEVWGDSALVVNQVNGEWQTKEPRLAVRCKQARELFDKFGRWKLSHHGREKSVEVLGH